MGSPCAAAAAAAGSRRSDMATASWPGIIMPGCMTPLYPFFFAMLACSSGTASFLGLRVTVELFMTVTRSARSCVSSNSSKSPSLIARPSTTCNRDVICQQAEYDVWQLKTWLLIMTGAAELPLLPYSDVTVGPLNCTSLSMCKWHQDMLTYLFPCFCLYCILILILVSPA